MKAPLRLCRQSEWRQAPSRAPERRLRDRAPFSGLCVTPCPELKRRMAQHASANHSRYLLSQLQLNACRSCVQAYRGRGDLRHRHSRPTLRHS